MAFRPLAAWLAFAMGAASSLTVAADPRIPLPRAQVRTFRPTESRTPIGVLGAVGRPGVYESASSAPSLSDVIVRAGGLSPDSTGNVRIIRNGKAGQQVFFTALTKFPLQAGDVVYIDGRAARAQAIRMASHTTTNGVRHDGDVIPADASPVQLAFVNLLDRPVVLKVRSEHATVERIVELLQQSPQAARTVRIIPPAGNPSGAKFTSTSLLPEGTVLVFEPSALDLSRIPALPPAYGMDGGVQTAEGTTPAAPRAAVATAPAMPDDREIPIADAPHSTGPVLPSAESRPEDPQAPIHPPVLTLSGRTPEGPMVSHPEAVVPDRRDDGRPPANDSIELAQGGKMEYLPPPPTPAQGDSVEMLPPSAENGAGVQQDEPAAGGGVDREITGYSEPIDAGSKFRSPFNLNTLPKPVNPRILVNRDDAASKAATAIAAMSKASKPRVELVGESTPLSANDAGDVEAGLSTTEIASIWGLFAVAAAGAAWVASRRAKNGSRIDETPAAAPRIAPATTRTAAAVRPLETVRPAATTTTSKKPRLLSQLDALIANELPLDIEQAKLPGRVEFYGKAKSKPYLRLDMAHPSEPRKPFFATEEVRERSAAAASRAATDIETPAAMPSGHRVDDAHEENRPHTAGAPARQPNERKADILERVLTAQDSGARHVGGPHIGAAMTRTSEAALAEGALQK